MHRIKELNGYFYIQKKTRDIKYPKWAKYIGLEDIEEWTYCNESGFPVPYIDYAYKTTLFSEAKTKKQQFEKPIKFYY